MLLGVQPAFIHSSRLSGRLEGEWDLKPEEGLCLRPFSSLGLYISLGKPQSPSSLIFPGFMMKIKEPSTVYLEGLL